MKKFYINPATLKQLIREAKKSNSIWQVINSYSDLKNLAQPERLYCYDQIKKGLNNLRELEKEELDNSNKYKQLGFLKDEKRALEEALGYYNNFINETELNDDNRDKLTEASVVIDSLQKKIEKNNLLIIEAEEKQNKPKINQEKINFK